MIKILRGNDDCFINGETTLAKRCYKDIDGTWIALSPTESLPEDCKGFLCSDISLVEKIKKINNVSNEWTILKLSEENNRDDIIRSVEEKINALPHKNLVKELDYFGGSYFWAVASKDLNFPSSYNKDILENNSWISEGEWSLVCIGKAEIRDDFNNMRKHFIDSLPGYVVYERNDI